MAHASAGFSDALARLPAGALPAPLAQLWLARAQAGAPMRDRPEVLVDTLAILTSLNADPEVLAAALLDALVDVEALAAEAGITLPERLRTLLEGQRAASRVWALHRDHGGGRNPEGMRRLLLALVRDLRVVLIVLARQLSRMRAAARLSDTERLALARMTRDIHAPLANRLGIWQLKWELEDLAFRILQPADYQRIAQSLDDSRAGRERYIAAVLAQLREALAAQGVQADVAGRPKHIYSIWKKMQRKGLPIEELYDLRAVRVLVEDIPACYAVLGLVHALWVPIPSEFDDYIARPKPNGYRSLHTAVIGPEGKTLEVQIRTREMHAQSELGVAAHWRYKEGGGGDAAMDRRIAWMRKLLEQAAEAAGEGDPSPLQGIDSELVEDRVYALTPKGEVVDLPQGATVLDFAYAIHTMVGHRCRGAKVDGRIVPLTHVLRTGERVEILTGKTPEPRRDWLQPSAGFLASSRSREKVRSWFNKLDRAHNIEEGRALLERDLRRLGLAHADLAPALARLNVSSEEDLLVAVALGDLTSTQVARALQEADKPASPPEPTPPAAPPRAAVSTTPGTGVVTVQGVDNLLVQMARCCQPLPGEPIIGYLTRTRGVSVHRPDCAAFLRLAGKEPARVLPVDWGRTQTAQAVTLRIEAVDRKWLIKDITTLLAQLGVHLQGLHTETARRGGARVQIRLQARVMDFEQLGTLLARLESLPGVESARRA
ncbi:RelA/SpoT family protein [Thermomonas alba]|uniref:RelA/SpoT family protein n=1 Tax=Thermomonas alba TaxID=2888525 RepID=UPI003F6E9161